MRTALLLTNTFHPDERGRAERLAARARHLQERGWETVVHVWPERPTSQQVAVGDATFTVHRAHDGDTVARARASTSPVTSGMKRLANAVGFPDGYAPLLPRGVRHAGRLVAEHDVDVIDTMCYPFSGHLLGRYLMRRHDVGWVAEFRDPWLTNPMLDDSRLRRLHRRLERATVRRADAITYNYGVQIPDDHFVTSYGVDEADVHVLDCPGSTGFDFERFEDVDATVFEETFTVTYAGSFYGDDHTPEDLLAALGSVVERGGLAPDDLTVRFFGDWSEAYDVLAEQHGVEEHVVSHGWQPFRQIVGHLRGSDAALLKTIPGDALNVPSKVVDYLAAETPIVAVTDPDSRTRDFVERHGVGVAAVHDDVEGISDAVMTIYRHRDDRGRFSVPTGLRRRIDADTQAAAFAAALDDAV